MQTVEVGRTGLGAGTLSQWETIGQSLANIAPTATPAMGIPVILTTSGNGSWLACVLALVAMVCVAHMINLFATRSSSAGSLYSFVDESLGARTSLLTAWALLIAYIGTGCAVTGGLVIYLYALLGGHVAQTGLVTAAITAVTVVVAGYLAYRDVHVSARLMLVIEAISILLILVLFLLPGTRTAVHWNKAQLVLAGTSAKQVRAGLVLAIFGFVGFESAASMGAEAVNPLKTIPRAISLTAWISGIFFVLAAYAETIGFAGHTSQMAESGAPLELLAGLRHLPMLGPLVSATTVCSFFACTLASITAAARTLYQLSEDGHVHAGWAAAHPVHRTPHVAILWVSGVVLAVPVALALGKVVPFDMYGWAGTFATFGFITAYLLVSVGAGVRMWRTRTVAVGPVVSLAISLVVLVLAGMSAFEPAEGVYRWLPYGYIGLLAAGTAVTMLTRKSGTRETMAAT